MEQCYDHSTRPLKEADVDRAANLRRSIPNSSLLSACLPGGESSNSDLPLLMQQRMARFLQNQNTAAEDEADRLAASVPRGLSPEEVKTRMGEKLGTDLSDVSFHTGSDALARTEAIGARAYTAGRNVYFGEGGFDSGVAAHELVHTAQQGSGFSGASASVAPGTVQMMPKLFSGIKHFFTMISNLVGNKPGKKEKRLNAQRVQNQDYSRYLRTSSSTLNAVEEQKKEELLRVLNKTGSGANDSVEDKIYKEYGNNNTTRLDPTLRAAMSNLAKKDPTLGGEISKVGDKMDQTMIINTMKKITPEQESALKEHYRNYDDEQRLRQEYDIAENGKVYLGSEGDSYDQRYAARDRTKTITDAIEAAKKNHTSAPKRNDHIADLLAKEAKARGQGSGDALLRLLFLMQLGFMSKTDTTKSGTETYKWDRETALALVGGGRTLFKMNTSQNENDSMDLMRQAIFGKDSGIRRRSAATHYVNDKIKEVGGPLAYLASKFKRKSFHHYGMDIGVGGVGTDGVMGAGHKAQMINADGRSGHMYVGQKDAGRNQKGAFLVGLETESPYRTSQYGQMHDAAANSSPISSTGRLKSDTVGKSKGGFTVDLSGFDNAVVINHLNNFTKHFTSLREKNEAGYNALLEKMSGKRMSEDELSEFLMKIGSI